MSKAFRLRPEEIRPDLAPGHGGCIATDRITVDGVPVGWMYREEPTYPEDSGWRFFAGDESEQYIVEVANSSVYDVNTIANYCPDILPFLDSPVGVAFERDDTAAWRPAHFPNETAEPE